MTLRTVWVPVAGRFSAGGRRRGADSFGRWRRLSHSTVADHDVYHADHDTHRGHHGEHEIEDPDFEIARPRGGGRFYASLMSYKVRGAIRLLGRDLTGTRVLVVCAGSGMDAELLTRCGPRVVCLDVSVGAMVRAAERARRYGLRYGLVAGDAERLPFADGTFDYAFVHDGLHHLVDPEGAITEMARVSRRGIIVVEPARAWVTALAIRLGVPGLDVEVGGDRVYRFRPADLRALFARLGLPTVYHQRYLIHYPHKPGRLFRLLDLPGVYQIASWAFLVFGVRVLGRAGNKLAIVGLAPDRHAPGGFSEAVA